MRASLVLAIFAASVASSDAEKESVAAGCFTLTTLESCCSHIDGRAGEYNGQDCVPTKALVGGETQTSSNEFGESHVCQPACWVSNTCEYTKPHGSFGDQTLLEGQCVTTTITTTTTITPWDSSASSSADSNSLESLYTSLGSSSSSNSFKEASSGSSEPSSGSSFFDSEASAGDSSLGSSGSNASGSSGSYLFGWQWLLLALCCCAAAIAPLLKPKPKKKAPKKPTGPAKTTLASDHPAGCTYLEVESQEGFKAGQTIEIGAGTPTAEIHDVSGLGSILLTAPLMYPHPAGTPVLQLVDPKVPAQMPVQPVATTSTVIPSYAMAAPTYAAPVAAYAAPATTAYATAPVSYATQAYAAPAYATQAYATQAYAAPGYAV